MNHDDIARLTRERDEARAAALAAPVKTETTFHVATDPYEQGPCHYCGRSTNRESLVYWPGNDGEAADIWLCATCDHYTANPVQVLHTDGRDMSDADVPF